MWTRSFQNSLYATKVWHDFAEFSINVVFKVDFIAAIVGMAFIKAGIDSASLREGIDGGCYY